MIRTALLLVGPPLACWLAAGPAPAQDPAAAPFAGTAAVSADTLRTIAGRADIVQEIQARNSATVSNTQIDGASTTGTISFDQSAFANLNGLSVLSANTGNNVAINASLNVNVSIRP